MRHLVAMALLGAQPALSFLHGAALTKGSAAFTSRGLRREMHMSAVQHAAADAAAAAAASGKAAVKAAKGIVNFAPTELVPRPPAMYEHAIALGTIKANLSWKRTLVLGLMSGFHVSISAMLAMAVGGNAPGILASNPGLQKYLTAAIGLPFGLYMTVVAGGELFTGNTALVTIAVLEKRATWKQLIRNWGVSYLANLVGSLALVYAVVTAGAMAYPGFAISQAAAKTSLSFGKAFLRGIICNWLVCMAVYMSTACHDATGKFVSIMLPISMFTAIGFEHSVANMTIIPMGMHFAGGVKWATFFLKNLLPVTLGNIVGGAGIVGLGYSAAYSTNRQKMD